jgi:hypothetical protein
VIWSSERAVTIHKADLLLAWMQSTIELKIRMFKTQQSNSKKNAALHSENLHQIAGTEEKTFVN